MTLFMATSTDYQVQDICEDTYVLSDTDCVDTELATISQQHFSETNISISTKEIPHTTAHMGFSHRRRILRSLIILLLQNITILI